MKHNHKFSFKKIFSFIFSIIMTLSLITFNTPISTSAAAENITYEISGDTSIGGAFQIAIKCTGISDLYAYSIDFNYDPNAIEVINISNGHILSNATSPTSPSTSPGLTSFIATQTGNISGVSENGTLAIINCKNNGSGGNLSLNSNYLKIKLCNSNMNSIAFTQAFINYTIPGPNPGPRPPYITSFTSSKTKNIGVNEPITIKATGSEEGFFEFYVKRDNGAWVKAQEMSSNNVFKYTPTEKGLYQVKVYFKGKDSTRKYDDTEAINFPVSVNPNESYSKLTSLVPSVTSTPAGQTVTFTANSTNQEDTLFEYYVLENGLWTRPQAFSYNNKFEWTPEKEGIYKIRVFAKNVNSSKKSDSYTDMTYTVLDPNITTYSQLTSLNSDKTSAALGESITFTANATPSDKTYYQFNVLIDGKWYVQQPWSTKNTYTMTPKTAGNYKVRCFVKHFESTNKNDGQLEMIVSVK